MLGSVTGFLGSGKSLFLTLLGVQDSNRTVYTNFSLDLDKAEEVTIEDLENIKKGLLLIDEGYMWLDSRLSSSEMNRYLSRFIFKSRKRQLDIFISSQLHRALDLRFRHLEDIRVHALGSDQDERFFTYVIEGWGSYKEVKFPMKKAKLLFPLFDTMEYPDEKASKFAPEQYNERVDELAGEIGEELGGSKKLSKGIVKDFLREKGITNSKLHEGIYYRLKRKGLED